MYKIDRRGGGVQKSYTRTDPKGVPGHTLHREIEIKQTNILSHLLVYLQLVRLQTFQQNMKLLFTKRPVYEK